MGADFLSDLRRRKRSVVIEGEIVSDARHPAYVAYAIVPPQIDRSKPAKLQEDPTLHAGVVKETDAGIYIWGAQQLATGSVYADYIHLSCIHPLRPGEANYAVSRVVPADAEGLRLYSRRAFPLQATSAAEYPLPSRLDETECMVVFDNLFVPWEHVFAYRNLEVCSDQWWKTPSHLYGNLPAQARYATKLRFLLGLAKRMNDMTGNGATPPVQVMMGELASYASIVDGMLRSQETLATNDEEGDCGRRRRALHSVMALQSEINSKMIDIVRELTGAAMITLPSSFRDLDNPDTAKDVERFYRSDKTDARTVSRSCASPGTSLVRNSAIVISNMKSSTAARPSS
jgi:4-hydroxyphenylacetate 3-monooxygenase